MAHRVLQMKKQVGVEAANRVQSGQVVGLGTGSTAIHAIARIGDRLKSGELRNVRGIPTSFQSSVLAREHQIPLTTLEEVGRIDIAIDGADEVDPHLNLIKGGGAAHMREKIIDALAEEFIVVIDSGKLVDRLGSQVPIPVEVLPLAYAPVMKALKDLGGKPDIRMGVKKAGPVITDQGNMVIDVWFDEILDPAAMELTINNLPGVLENGLFVQIANTVLVGEITEEDQPTVRQLWAK